jgi:succinate-semialdehyde dehydrogenase/glutarate-semialdehyde dehydrogenase
MNLKNKNLLQSLAYINGQWVEASDAKTLQVRNPYDGSLLAEVANCGAAETQLAIDSAATAFKKWRQYTGSERGQILRRWYELQLEHLEDLALILTLEQGKPLNESRGEVKYGASFVEWFAEEARRTYGDVIPGHARDKRIMTLKQPIGVVAAITPWNFPNAMITRKVAPALAAGCTVVIKPSELTPLSALALAYLAEKAGFPPGVLNIINTDSPKEVGNILTKSPIIRKLSFTGSTPVGKILLKQCADTVKKVSLELGGNAPFIVFNDADIDEAVQGAIASKYRNAGQTCVCTNRIFVQEKVYDAFAKKFTEAVKNQKMGNGLHNDVTIGPLVEEKAVQFVEEVVEDALNKGATLTTGGKRYGDDPKTLLFEPTILTNVNSKMKVFSKEIFGPVAPIFKFKTEAEVVELANDTPYGLAAYFFGRDYALIWRVAEALEYGIVGINTGMISTTVAPFGGIKESGFGREGSKYGMDDYLEIKYLCIGGIDS